MKTSEKIVIGELLIIGGLGMMAFGRGCLMLCDRVTVLENQQKKINKLLKTMTDERVKQLNEKVKKS